VTSPRDDVMPGDPETEMPPTTRDGDVTAVGGQRRRSRRERDEELQQV